MSWHPKINETRRTALKTLAKNIKPKAVEERLVELEKIKPRISAIEAELTTKLNYGGYHESRIND